MGSREALAFFLLRRISFVVFLFGILSAFFIKCVFVDGFEWCHPVVL